MVELLNNSERVQQYLIDIGMVPSNGKVTIHELTGGVSNRSYWIDFQVGDDEHATANETWVLKQAREKLNVQVDWFCHPDRIHREALGMHWLRELTSKDRIVELIHEDFENHIIIMEAVEQPHENWKTILLRGEVFESHIQQFAELLALIHRNSQNQAHKLESIFQDRSYFEQLRLEPYYGFAAENVPEAQAFLQALIESTKHQTLALVHGDYSPKNVLVHHDQLVLLDHEVIHWGDPSFDIGFSMTHFLSKALHLSECKTRFVDAAHLYWSVYQNMIGSNLYQSNLEYRAIQHTLACLLARVAGRSPLEYLNEEEKIKQREIVLKLINDHPQTMPECIDRFIERI